jgi:O-succinylbenzoic acid--CoA ligase
VLVDRGHRAASTALRDTIDLEDIAPGGPSPAIAKTPAEAPAVIVLTSGTTDRPKAAVLSGGALAASAEAWLAALPPATGWLLVVGLGHVAGLGVIWRAALGRVPLVVVEPPSPDAILGAIRADPYPSHVSLVPTTLARLLDLPDATPPATLRAVPLGGGPIDPGLVEAALAAGWPVVPTYGLTEAGSGVTALPTTEAAAHPGSAGRPLSGVRVRIDDPDRDGVGEILVETPARFSGYLGDATVPDPATTTDGWLRTGDHGRLDDDARLFVVDRRTDRIVRGGENVSPAEVEAVLRRHPAIADAAVIARPDPVYGQVPVALVVVREGATDPTDDALAAYCREQLARFKVPVAFDRRSSLPRTASGKVRRAELGRAELRRVELREGRHQARQGEPA